MIAPFILVICFIIIVLSLLYLSDVVCYLEVYGIRMKRFKEEYGYIKDITDCGILFHDFLYPMLIGSLTEKNIKYYGKVYQQCYPFLFLVKEKPTYIKHDIEELIKKYKLND
jgi:hypothetical protein